MDLYENILNEFLERWREEDVEEMTLQEYVGIKNKDTFCQWVETKTILLGSIKGLTSIKFGIYERENPNKRPKNYRNGDKYSWLRGYGNNEKEVFKNVKNDILKIINLAQKGDFKSIDEIILPNLFKWKVAFLYSNERLVPIFNQKVLLKIANHYDFKATKKTRISDIQAVLISMKPSHQSVYKFMRELYDRFGDEEKKSKTKYKEGKHRRNQRKRKRKASSSRNTEDQSRKGARSYIAKQKHNKLQERLIEILKRDYGEENVILEENFVDVKLIQPDYIGFYEVKSASYASDCIIQALGQILLYTHYDDDVRQKKIFVVGQYPATDFDKKYITYIKETLNIDFDYFNLSIS